MGSLLVSRDVLAAVPSDANPQYLPTLIRRAHPSLAPLYYVDNWPNVPPMLMAIAPAAQYQVTQEHSLPKVPGTARFLRPIAGGPSIVTDEGAAWKTWRTIFNPGFSAGHLTSLVPEIVRSVTVFCDVLTGHAERGDLFPLKPITDNLTMDIIGKIVL